MVYIRLHLSFLHNFIKGRGTTTRKVFLVSFPSSSTFSVLNFSPTMNGKSKRLRSVDPNPLIDLDTNDTKNSECSKNFSHLSTSSTITGSAAAPWHIASAKKCVGCGKIVCTCPRTRLDPEEKRRRLEKLSLHTPYARKKAWRYTEKVQAEEKQGREDIASLWAKGYQRHQQLFSSMFVLCRMCSMEASSRNILLEEEQLSRAHLFSRFYGWQALSHLTQWESDRRRRLCGEEETERMVILHKKMELDSIHRLIQQERSGRDEINMMERSRREIWESSKTTIIRELQVTQLALDSIYAEQEANREELYQSWRKEWYELRNVFDDTVAMQRNFEEKVISLSNLFLQQFKCKVPGEEAAARQVIYQEMKNALDDLEIVLFNRERQMAELCNEEQETRLNISTKYSHTLMDLHAQEKISRERLHMWEKNTQESAGRLIQEAFRQKDVVLLEEAEAFLHIFSLEQREREQNIAWMQTRALLRTSIVEGCFQQKEELVCLEEKTRKMIYDQVSEMLEWRMQWELTKKQKVQSIVNEEAEIRRALEKTEHDDFFDLYYLKGENENAARRIFELRVSEQEDILQQEKKLRGSLYREWESDRELMFAAFWRREEEIHHCYGEFQANIQQIETLDTRLRRDIEDEEEIRRSRLVLLHQRNICSVMEQECHRGIVSLKEEESQKRLLLHQEEARSFECIVEMDVLARAQHKESRLSCFRNIFRELFEEEQMARQLLFTLEHKDFQHQIVSGELEERQQILKVLETNSEHETKVNSAVAALQEALVERALGIQEGSLHATFNRDAIDYVCELIQRMDEWGRCAEEKTGKARAEVERTIKKVELLTQKIEGKREQKEQYGKKLKREREELEKLEKQLKENRKRCKVELQSEATLLLSAEKELKKETETLESLRENINAFLSRPK